MTDAAPLLAGDELTTRVYIMLLQQTAPRRSTLLKEGFTEDEVALALTSLELRGMVNATRRDVIDVFPPDTTLPAYAADLERQARTTRSAVEGLTHMYNEARSGEGAPRSNRDVTLLATVDDVEAAFFRAGRRAESRVVRLVARSERMDRVVIRHAESILAARPTTTRRTPSPGSARPSRPKTRSRRSPAPPAWRPRSSAAARAARPVAAAPPSSARPSSSPAARRSTG